MKKLQMQAEEWLSQPTCMVDQWDFYCKNWWKMTDTQRSRVLSKLDALTHPTDVEHIKKPYTQKIREIASAKRMTRTQRKKNK